jgi:hypothetical protein
MEQKAEKSQFWKKRRFKMVTGLNDSHKRRIAMHTELARRKKPAFPSLSGKPSIITSAIIIITAIGKKPTEPRFSGFLMGKDFRARETNGKPVLFDSCRQQDKRTGAVSLFANLDDNMILYRIPDQVNARLIYGEDILSEALVPVFQTGALVRMELQPAK